MCVKLLGPIYVIKTFVTELDISMSCGDFKDQKR